MSRKKLVNNIELSPTALAAERRPKLAALLPEPSTARNEQSAVGGALLIRLGFAWFLHCFLTFLSLACIVQQEPVRVMAGTAERRGYGKIFK